MIIGVWIGREDKGANLPFGGPPETPRRIWHTSKQGLLHFMLSEVQSRKHGYERNLSPSNMLEDAHGSPLLKFHSARSRDCWVISMPLAYLPEIDPLMYFIL